MTINPQHVLSLLPLVKDAEPAHHFMDANHDPLIDLRILPPAEIECVLPLWWRPQSNLLHLGKFKRFLSHLPGQLTLTEHPDGIRFEVEGCRFRGVLYPTHQVSRWEKKRWGKGGTWRVFRLEYERMVRLITEHGHRRCDHWDKHGRCAGLGEFYPITPNGLRCPGGPVCVMHGLEVCAEYVEKLGEEWTMEPIVRPAIRRADALVTDSRH